MRTSYNRGVSQDNNPVEKNVERVKTSTEQENIKEEYESSTIYKQIVSGYTSVKNNIEKSNGDCANSVKDENFQQSEEPAKVEEPEFDKGNKKSTKAKKAKKPVKIIVAAVIGLTIVTTAVVTSKYVELPMLSKPSSTESTESGVEVISKYIDALYTNEEKVEIAVGYSQTNVDKLYCYLSDAATNGEDTSELVDELNTISKYMSDEAQLGIYIDTEYDLATESLYDNVLKLQTSFNDYTVEGLKTTMVAKSTALLAEIDEYNRIKEQLVSTTDVSTLDVPAITENIKVITHTKNRDELNNYIIKLEADKKVADAEAALAAADSEESKTAAEVILNDAKSEQESANKALAGTSLGMPEPTPEMEG